MASNKNLFRIVNDFTNQENTLSESNYYIEFSRDSGKTWKCSSCWYTTNSPKGYISENILWVIEDLLRLGYRFVGVWLSGDIDGWEPYL